MKKHHVLFERGERRWTVLYQDPDKKADLLDSNEYLVSSGKEHMLLDPGGFAVFPAVYSTLVQLIDPAKDLKFVFASHQDPDIASSLSLWQKINPEIRCYVSWLWSSFVPHFGGTEETYISIEDKGQVIDLNGYKLQAVPAHHCHSAGNFHLFDPEAKIYFSGDAGAALLPNDQRRLFVDDFEAHIPHIEYFHRRWFGSNAHKNEWCDRALDLDIQMLCPQHGSIYVGEQVGQFLHWLRGLNVGTTSNKGLNP